MTSTGETEKERTDKKRGERGGGKMEGKGRKKNSQQQGIFLESICMHQVAKVLEFQVLHQAFQ